MLLDLRTICSSSPSLSAGTTQDSGANAWKVAMALDERNVPYPDQIVEFQDTKKEPHD